MLRSTKSIEQIRRKPHHVGVESAHADFVEQSESFVECREAEKCWRPILECSVSWRTKEMPVILHRSVLQSAAGKPRTRQSGKRGPTRHQRTDSGGEAEYLVEGERHEI